MFKFDAQDYPYASKRHVVYAKNGMSCVGNPSGAAAGLKVLLQGGNAIDAAVAVASAQPVVEPPVTVLAPTASHSFGIRANFTASTAPAPCRKPLPLPN